ncbi:hypothetical protein HPP92_009799 [Vanilla planifolia]|uniref:Uncharacterized protein n=1 Tax=Vanilla planifolia TaxID=51239 RepID=A0A835V509_VANPL|nr:hypothetical protein HPP92_009799 [Vanilla planifolia]
MVFVWRCSNPCLLCPFLNGPTRSTSQFPSVALAQERSPGMPSLRRWFMSASSKLHPPCLRRCYLYPGSSFSHDFCFSHVVVTFGLYVKMRRLWCLDFGQCNGLVAENCSIGLLSFLSVVMLICKSNSSAVGQLQKFAQKRSLPSESTLIRRRFTPHVGRSENIPGMVFVWRCSNLVSFVLSSMVPPVAPLRFLRGASAREISRNALLRRWFMSASPKTSPAVPPPLLSLSRFFLSLMISVLVTWSLPWSVREDASTVVLGLWSMQRIGC